MAHVAGHLGVDELQAGYRGSDDATLARHYQVIWLLAQGRTCAEVAGLTSFALRWVEQLLERYNAFGPGSLGDRRRGNGGAGAGAPAARRRRVWTAKKVAMFMAVELGRHVAEQRGWEALRAIGWTIQSPRPRHAEAASPEAQAAFKKSLPRSSRRKPSAIPARRWRPSPPTSTGSAWSRSCAGSGPRAASVRSPAATTASSGSTSPP